MMGSSGREAESWEAVSAGDEAVILADLTQSGRLVSYDYLFPDPIWNGP